MKPVRVGNAAVGGIAIGPEGERIAIEVKSPRDDMGEAFVSLLDAQALVCTSMKRHFDSR